MAHNTITAEQYADYMARGLIEPDGRILPQGGSGTAPAKYRNVKVEIDGRTFDSKKEANYYLDLREQQRAGVITNLRCQVPYPLTVNGVTVCEYIADFVYDRDGRTFIEDVKSAVTRKLPVYRLKVKLMLAFGWCVTEV